MDPITTAEVSIWDETIGAVSWLSDQGCAAFEYDPEFLRKALELSPIHMSIGEANRGTVFSFPNIDQVTFWGLPGLLASCLPDLWGNQIIDSWLRRNGREPQSFNPVERLCYIGTRGMGALEFRPQLSDRSLSKSVPVEIENLMALAREVMAERLKLDANLSGTDTEKAEAMFDILRVGTSAGGAVPKAIIAMDDQGHIISGQSHNIPQDYTHWILKFDGVSEEQPDKFRTPLESGRIEYAYYLMASQAGINMEECHLLEENGRAHFITKRFDRVNGRKIHMLTLAGMAHFGWNPPGVYGYEDAFAIMRQLRLTYPEQEQQFRRMVFNAITKNLDDHTKNISYLMDADGVWKLSPAYDMTFSYSSIELFGDQHKMKINNKRKDFTGGDFLNVAKSMEINKPNKIIDQIIEAVTCWPDHAKKAGVNEKSMTIVEDMIFESSTPVQRRLTKIRSDELKKRYNL
ncbi:MAG: type II toxin-antitoxin system HipA family toxin [Desulfobacterales bacterium]|nr:type II toxin-antitoxin system HipA family toxin [Desulfobacterales bacterium]